MRFDIPDKELTWKFSPTGGPGGQHANKASTRVEVTFDVAASAAFDDATRQRLVRNLGEQVRVVEDGSRSQATNRKRALRRLDGMLSEASKPDPPPRKATKPSRRAQQRRLDKKRQRAELKATRKNPPPQ